ncbi:MAG TPA: glutamate--tRNA ligase [Thermoplasmatales archaeon]|nr:glutamate--tRNA ligase [Thermoplasmatales archaeon]
MNLEELARKYALLNAFKYEGKANLKAVIGKVMTDFKGDAKEIIPIVKKIVEEVNSLSLEEQKREIDKLGIKFEEKKKEKKKLPPLPNARKGEVITRFPPEPNGYLHIGHAKAAFIDYEYARIYDGIFILRFDDTNPANEKKEFYEAQKEDLKWLGIEWDREYRTSDNVPKHYEFAKKMLEEGNAYICTCSEEKIRENRRKGIECECRKSGEISWSDFFSMREGEGVLRLKGDMKSKNTAMRDPVLFRITEHPHPIHGNRFRVWPTYDFYGAVEDSLSGVTHPFRSKEYELRDEVYFYLLDCLGLRKPHLMEFSRLEIKGMPVSKRKIKPLIDKKIVTGWDDPRLPTLKGLRKRGILPEAIKEFVLSQGISRTESVVVFENLEAVNRKILDGISKRYFFVPHPVKLKVNNAPSKEVILKYHPSVEMGKRKLKTGEIFYIPLEDANKLKKNDIFRLKDLYNVEVIEKGMNEIKGKFSGEKMIEGIEKIQWVSHEYLKMDVIVPHLLYKNGEFNEKSIEIVKGYAEKNVEEVENNEIVQFERFGFVKIEKDDEIKGILTHK